LGNKQAERKIANSDICKGALGESLLWQCCGFRTRVLNHREPVVTCKPSLWPHLLQSPSLFTVQLTSLLFCFSFPSQNSIVLLGFRVLSCRFLLTQIGTSLNFYSFSFFWLLNHCHAFRRIQYLSVLVWKECSDSGVRIGVWDKLLPSKEFLQFWSTIRVLGQPGLHCEELYTIWF
jgi:hypothetical protein